MYLSRVELDLIRRSTMEALAAPQKLHGEVESAFAGARRRRQWRLARLGEQLLVASFLPGRAAVSVCFQVGRAGSVRRGGAVWHWGGGRDPQL